MNYLISWGHGVKNKNGQILFFPLKAIKNYHDDQELERLENIQIEIKAYRFRLLKDIKNTYDYILESQKLANFFTGMIKAVKD